MKAHGKTFIVTGGGSGMGRFIQTISPLAKCSSYRKKYAGRSDGARKKAKKPQSEQITCFHSKV